MHIVTSNNSGSLCFSSIVTAQHSLGGLKYLKINVFNSKVVFLVTQVSHKRESSMVVESLQFKTGLCCMFDSFSCRLCSTSVSF